MARLKVFISSVQKELADERMAMQILLATDPFLQKHAVPRLFEYVPAPLMPNTKGYLVLLRSCNLFVLILGKEYGVCAPDTGLSAIHEEYRLAKELRLPILVCVKGDRALARDQKIQDLLEVIKANGYTYSRFESLEELQKKTRERIAEHIKTVYDVTPTPEDDRSAEQNIASADLFERQRLDRVRWEDLDTELARTMIAAAEDAAPGSLTEDNVRDQLFDRGYLWFDPDRRVYFATAAGILLLAPDPSKIFTHARIQADAYVGKERTAKADDHTFLRGPITRVLDDAVRFMRQNTRHPIRVVGLRRIQVDEYPETALREVLVNAMAHRDYRDAGQKVTYEVFHDRIVVTNPGLPPGGQSLVRIAAGRGRSRSRNPLLAQGLAWLKAMEDRGTGIMRMAAAMLDHGLGSPVFSKDDGCVVVTLPGPGDDMDRIRVPEQASKGLTPAQEKALNKRQKSILHHAVETGTVTNRWCRAEMGVVYDTAYRDLTGLVKLGLLRREGKGRAALYVLVGKIESTDNPPIAEPESTDQGDRV